MKTPIRLRLIFSLALTVFLMLLVLVVHFITQQQIDEAQARIHAQQLSYDYLRRSQVLVLRARDAVLDSAAGARVDGWRSELDALVALTVELDGTDDQGATAYVASYAEYSRALAAALDAASRGDADGASAIARRDLAPATAAVLDHQDALLAGSLRMLDAARDRYSTVVLTVQGVRLVGGLVALLLVVFGGWISLNWAGNSLADLARQVRRAAANPAGRWPDFHVEPAAPREVHDLTTGFNELVAQLRQHSIDMEHANLKLEALNAEVLAASRAKSAFLATMSHELRTPLNAIIGFSEMLMHEMYGPLNEKQHMQLERMLRNSQNLLTLINDVLDISRVEAGKLPLQTDTFPPDRVIGGVAAAVEPLVRQKNLTMVVDIARPLPQITTDESRLRQVLLNLASNAVKFTRQGTITVGAHLDPALPNWLVFTVADSGIGIPVEDLDRIWDEFYQVNNGLTREAGGSGLGLAIVRKLIDVLGGDIEVQSIVGQGTRFLVYLPLAPTTVGDGAAGASLYAATGSFVLHTGRKSAPPVRAE